MLLAIFFFENILFAKFVNFISEKEEEKKIKLYNRYCNIAYIMLKAYFNILIFWLSHN